jgi:hypothetical protein
MTVYRSLAVSASPILCFYIPSAEIRSIDCHSPFSCYFAKSLHRWRSRPRSVPQLWVQLCPTVRRKKRVIR